VRILRSHSRTGARDRANDHPSNAARPPMLRDAFAHALRGTIAPVTPLKGTDATASRRLRATLRDSREKTGRFAGVSNESNLFPPLKTGKSSCSLSPTRPGGRSIARPLANATPARAWLPPRAAPRRPLHLGRPPSVCTRNAAPRIDAPEADNATDAVLRLARCESSEDLCDDARLSSGASAHTTSAETTASMSGKDP
jgi:hypothetical protein